jgi:predicted amidohydrolase
MMIASVQCDFEIGNIAANLEILRHRLQLASENGSKLIVFPECALSGYCFDSREEAFEASIIVDNSDPVISQITNDCNRLNVHVIFGLLERDGNQVYNSSTCVGPEGIVSNYRKLHLPFLGVDRFVDPGDLALEVFEVAGIKVGMHICYDGGFPELARSYALMGADLVVLPTCWPPAADIFANHVLIARALENQIYTLASLGREASNFPDDIFAIP